MLSQFVKINGVKYARADLFFHDNGLVDKKDYEDGYPPRALNEREDGGRYSIEEIDETQSAGHAAAIEQPKGKEHALNEIDMKFNKTADELTTIGREIIGLADLFRNRQVKDNVNISELAKACASNLQGYAERILAAAIPNSEPTFDVNLDEPRPRINIADLSNPAPDYTNPEGVTL
jgi:hypothetical protein